MFKKVLIYPYRKDILYEFKLLSSNSSDANIKLKYINSLKRQFIKNNLQKEGNFYLKY